MIGLIQDLKFAARMFRGNPAIVVLSVIALALGIGANTAIFSVVRATLLRPLPYHDPQHLYDLTAIDAKGRASAFSMADFLSLRDNNGSFAGISTSNMRSSTLSGGAADAERVYALRVTEDCFAILGVPALQGRTLLPGDFKPGAPPSVVLSQRIWQRRYASDPNIIGTQILLDGESFTVAGVMPPQFEYRNKALEMWIPWIPSAGEFEARKDHGRTLLARLKPGVSIAQVQAELDAFANGMSTAFPRCRQELASSHRTHQARISRSISSAATSLARRNRIRGAHSLPQCRESLISSSRARGREIAVRIAIGASRWRIIRQLLTESFVLAFLGAICGLALAWWGERALIAAFPAQIPLPHIDRVSIDGVVLAFALAVTMLTSILFGLAPALQLSRTGIYGSLKPTRGANLRSVLIVAETALSLILLAGAGLMIRSFSKLVDVSPGFHAEHVLTVVVPVPSEPAGGGNRNDFYAAQAAKYQQMLTRVESLPGVLAAGLVSVLPLGPVETTSSIALEGEAAFNDDFRVQFRAASPTYFKAMGISVLAGRTFNDGDVREAPGAVIVSDALARRFWPGQNPIGKHMTATGKPVPPWLTVVGVVAGIRHRSLAELPEPELYRPYQQFLGPAFGAAIVVRGVNDPSTLTAAIRHEIHSLYHEQPIGDARLMTQVVADSTSQPPFLHIPIGCIRSPRTDTRSSRIYGVMSYSVAQRTREIGIRVALGAPGRGVVTLVLSGGMRLVFIGIALGLAGSLALTRLIANQLYATSPTDPATLIAVSVGLSVIAFAAAYLPARRASRVDPMVALRHD